MITTRIQEKITLALQIFLMGMVRQFLAHTILTYGLKLPSFLSFIWVWKEVIIGIIAIAIAWFFYKNKEYRKKILSNNLIVIIVGSIVFSILASLGNSLFIHHQSLSEFAVSAKFN